MRKFLSIVSLSACAAFSAQAQYTLLDSAVYVANFSKDFNGGLRYHTPLSIVSNSTTNALAYDRNGNRKHAITVDSGNVELVGAAEYTLNEYTIGFWYKKKGGTNSNVTGRSFFMIPNNSNNSYYEGTHLGFNALGNLHFGHVHNTNVTTDYTTPPVPTGVDVEEWNYYTLVQTTTSGTGKKLTLYVNGSYVDEVTFSSLSSPRPSNSIYLGGEESLDKSNRSFQNGEFDNLRIYDQSFDQSTVMDLYNLELSDMEREDVQAHYKFDDINDIGLDSKTNFNADLVNNPSLTKDRNGADNKALLLTGNANYSGIKIPFLNDYFTKEEGAIAFYMKPSAHTGTVNTINPVVYIANHGAGDGKMNHVFSFGVTSDLKLKSGSTLTDTTQATLMSTNALDTSRWYHCALTFNLSTMFMYLDGELVGSQRILDFPERTNGGGQAITIGYSHDFDGKTSFKGAIDDLIFHDEMMSQTEIRALVDENTAVSKVKLEGVNVYPNPVNDMLHINVKGDATITDMTGKVVMKVSDTDQINVAGLHTGMYILHIKQGEAVGAVKFMKK